MSENDNVDKFYDGLYVLNQVSGRLAELSRAANQLGHARLTTNLYVLAEKIHTASSKMKTAFTLEIKGQLHAVDAIINMKNGEGEDD